jgi:inhibitor of KinA sporulation pathway (predicted exonuclease)
MSLQTALAAEFFRLERVVLLDCEFTCWEGSLASNWAEPNRPAELIDIALVEYDSAADRIGETLETLVRPTVSPVLSAYCTSVTGIRQNEVEGAPPIREVFNRIAVWRLQGDRCHAPICAWGTYDFHVITQEALRHGCPSPIEGGRRVSLPDLYRTAVSRQAFGDGERDTIRRNLGLHQCEGRHRALADALDLAGFLVHLRSMAKAG